MTPVPPPSPRTDADDSLVDEYVVGRLVEGVVEAEVLVLQVFGEVDLGLWLVYDRLVSVRDGYDVHFLLTDLCRGGGGRAGRSDDGPDDG